MSSVESGVTVQTHRGTQIRERTMVSWNRRDLVSGFVIVFLLGILAGQWLHNQAGAAEPTAGTAPVATGTGVGGTATPGSLRAAGTAFAEVAAKVTPAVVNINSTRIIRGQTYYDPFREFFYGDGRIREPDRKSESLGSGVIIDPNGTVVTNNHNIEGADEVRVSLSDSRDFKATVVGRDPSSDIAVLRIDGHDLPHVAWGNSDALRVGEWVIAIGNPYGFSETVTAGIVSAKGRRDVGLSEFEDFIQTDAAINPGNSGGALVDINGDLVGINTAIFSKTGGYQGIGFAIPSEVAKRYSDELIAKGKVVRGWVGVIVRSLNSRTAQQLGLQSTAGAVVTMLWRGQPAITAGLQIGDVIVKAGDQEVNSPRDLRVAVSDAKIGSSLSLTVLRGGKRYTSNLKVAEHPQQESGEPVPGI